MYVKFFVPTFFRDLQSFGFVFKLTISLKPGSHLPNIFFICVNDSSSVMIKNAFYFILKALFVLKIFKFLSLYFGPIVKQLD